MLTDSLMIDIARTVALWFELVGIGLIVAGTLLAFVRAGLAFAKASPSAAAERRSVVPEFRKTLGRSILIGLELLVASDIIHTVAVELSLRSVLVLGLIVLIRTFLSISLEVEIDGKWPWRRAPEK